MPHNPQALELLSPAKNADIGIEAFRHGADAVYIGGPSFGARSAAGNSLEDISRLCETAHRFRGRVMMTLNTILRDEEIEPAAKLAWDAWNAGVDALIVQDMGLLEADLPPIQLHASTQCDIRTPEKAKFLEETGFSQIVPARELKLPEIRAIADVLTSARIEFFVHGALCVSYSGQCYASETVKCRSANRGACAQICRLPFDAALEDGTVLARHQYLLSLKDNNQSGNLAELVAAGVRSFKIEGRLKDMDYVKNITAFYRKKLDAFLNTHPEYAKESVGDVRFSFTPDPAKTFNRGATEYFVHGRIPHIATITTPKNAGEPIGTVKKINARSIVIRANEPLHNGDGLTFYDQKGELSGLLANRVEPLEGRTTEIFTRESPAKLANLRPGTQILRNHDQAWTRELEGDTSVRKIPVRIEASVDPKSISLSIEDAEGCRAAIRETMALDPAKNGAKSLEQQKNALSKLGDTDYRADTIELHEETPLFVPVSVLNNLRRSLVEKFEEARRGAFTRWERAPVKVVPFPVKTLDYRANVYNSRAKAFYEERGATVTQMAFETGEVRGEAELMHCRHCIRYTLGICPKEAIKRGEKIRPTPIVLTSGPMKFIARFHCGPCEMTLHGERTRG